MPVARTIKERLGGNSLSSGQVYFLLMLSRGSNTTAPSIVEAIESHWASAPYHLKLDLMDAARMCYSCDDRDRAALIAAIEALPQPGNVFVSTTIVDPVPDGFSRALAVRNGIAVLI